MEIFWDVTKTCRHCFQAKAYSIDHETPPKQQHAKNGKHPNGRASAYADLQQHRSEGVHRKPSPVSGYVPQPDYLEEDEDNDLIKPKKLVNPVKASKSHQELHRELMSSCKRSSGVSVETKPELQRVLESRKRDQLIKQRKQEEEARRKISPLEAELLKRHQKLDELDKQQEKEQEENLKAPEFVKVKENLRRTSFHKEEKEV
uniref:Actin-associated protein FAM107A n=1 Tax=Gasterosteus aculeatus aculeatus TaxID=481459 RepID=A0AAQ4PAD6_GASAC